MCSCGQVRRILHRLFENPTKYRCTHTRQPQSNSASPLHAKHHPSEACAQHNPLVVNIIVKLRIVVTEVGPVAICNNTSNKMYT